MQENGHVLKVLKGTKEAVKNEDVIKLKKLSNQTIHTASITQDPDNIAIAVVVYSLSKIIEREKHQQDPKIKEFHKKVVFLIDGAIAALKKNSETLFKSKIKGIRSEIGKLSGGLKKYIQDVFRKASINKASKIYEHGISLEKTASLLGITMYELAIYAGSRDIASGTPKGPTVRVRIKTTMEMFK